MIRLKSEDEIVKMRAAGQLVARVLQILKRRIKPGITTKALNAIAESEARKHNAIPVFKNYPHPHGGKPFSGAICTSVNDEVVHGIPCSNQLKEGDIISIDFGVILNGYAGDAAITVPVGKVDPELLRLIRVTEEALLKGIAEAKVGNRLGKISRAVQEHAETHGYSVVRDFVGHGIGQEMHEYPPVPNFGRPDRGPVLKAGMTLAIEPMLNIGTFDVYTKIDEWTVATKDGTASAHFEHTIAIRETGPEILTMLEPGR